MLVSSSVRVALAIAVCAALTPATATAAPGSLGPGQSPHVAVDGAGTAHIAYNGNESNNKSLRFCRLPRGATACATSTLIGAPGDTVTRPFVMVSGSTVRVFSYRFGVPAPSVGVHVFVSTDGGATFPTSGVVSGFAFHDAIAGPGADAVSFVSHADGAGELYQRAPIDPPPTVPAQKAVLSSTHLYHGTVGLIDADTPLVMSSTAASDGQFRRYVGSGEINDAANWAAPVGLGYADYGRLAGGPAGLFLMHSNQTFGGPLLVRRYDGAGFSAPVGLPDGAADAPQAELTQDPAGRLHAMWPRNSDVGGPQLFYGASDNGSAWTKGTLATDTGFYGVRAALAADHVGFAVWHTAGAGGEVHYLGVGPLPPVAAPPPPPPPPPAPPAKPAPYSGALRPVALSDTGGKYTLTIPRGCVLPGQTYRVTLKWRRKTRKGNLFVKLYRTDFYQGTARLRIDRKAPFVHTFTVRVTQARGSTIKLRARAFIKVRRGKVPKKSVRATIKVCS